MEKEMDRLISVSSWFVSLQVLTLIAFLGCAAIVYLQIQDLRQLVVSTSALSGAESVREISGWRKYIRAHNASTSQDESEVTIIEFTDFQCPYCRRFNSSTRRELQERYGDRVRFVFKHFPLEAIHTEARAASMAAQCALREGKFWEVKDAFFESPDYLSQEFFLEQGSKLRLGADYAACVQDGSTEAEVAMDIQDGLDIGVQGTPTFLVNGMVLNGVMPLAKFEEIIEELGH